MWKLLKTPRDSVDRDKKKSKYCVLKNSNMTEVYRKKRSQKQRGAARETVEIGTNVVIIREESIVRRRNGKICWLLLRGCVR